MSFVGAVALWLAAAYGASRTDCSSVVDGACTGDSPDPWPWAVVGLLQIAAIIAVVCGAVLVLLEAAARHRGDT